LLAPKGTPKEIVEAIALAAKKASEEQKAAIEASLDKAGMMINYQGPEGFAQFLSSQSDYWTKTVSRLDLKK
jgi:tripartite-type tricarboxylate transporter receptor subunit TctC